MTEPPIRYAATARSALVGAVAQFHEAGLSPLAIVGAALTPAAYGVAVIAGYGLPTGALLLGCVAAGLWGSLHAQSALIVIRERAQGTLQLIAASPVRISTPLLGQLLAAGCQSVAAVPLLAVVIVALFGGIHDFELSLFVVALIPITAGLIGMALLLMGALARYRYSAGMVNGLFGTIVLLGGFFVPMSAMPPGIRAISSALPSTWAIQAVRPGAAHHWVDLGIAGLLAAGWLAAGMVYLSGAPRRLRKIGFYQQ